MADPIEFPSRPFWRRYQQTQPTYGDLLQSMEEEPLHLNAGTRPTTYRLLLVPSLIKQPSVTRVFREKSEWRVVGKVSDGPGGLSVGRLVWEFRRVLHTGEATRVERLIDRVQFLGMPERVDPRRGVLDGVTWVLEGVQNQTYHVIYRHSPDEKPLSELGDYLVELSRVNDCTRDPEFERQRREAEQREWGRQKRSEVWAVARSNHRMRPLIARLEHEGLTCPHCCRHSRDIRFVDQSPKAKSYFHCNLCGRTFGSE